MISIKLYDREDLIRPFCGWKKDRRQVNNKNILFV